MSNRYIKPILLNPLFAISVSSFLIIMYFSIFAPLFPLNGDEAWNYVYFSSHGPIYTITHYDLPNNHIFFTFLQSIFLQRNLLSHLPLGIRLLNSLYGMLFLAFDSFIVLRLLKKNMSFKIILFIFLSIFFTSPLITPFFIEARGYILGTSLLLLGIYFLAINKVFWSSLPFTLAVWTIPTFILAMPFPYLLALIIYRRKWKDVAISGLLIPVMTMVLYAPVLNVLFTSMKYWGFTSLEYFFLNTFSTISNFSYINHGGIFNGIYFIVYLFSLVIVYKAKNHKELRRFVLFMFVSNINYLLIIFASFEFGLSNSPFLRNGFFIPVSITLTIIMASFILIKRAIAYTIWAILLLNICIGVYLFSNSAINHGKFTYPVYVGEQFFDSTILIKFIQNPKVKFLLEDNKDNGQIHYYSEIYSVPLKPMKSK